MKSFLPSFSETTSNPMKMKFPIERKERKHKDHPWVRTLVIWTAGHATLPGFPPSPPILTLRLTTQHGGRLSSHSPKSHATTYISSASQLLYNSCFLLNCYLPAPYLTAATLQLLNIQGLAKPGPKPKTRYTFLGILYLNSFLNKSMPHPTLNIP